MYNPATRLLTILELLQAHPVMGGAALARHLEVEPRTIRRYIVMLQDMGMPIEAVRGLGGGYRLRPGFKLPPLMLNDDEAAAVTLALLGSAWLDIELAGVAGALAKIMRVLPLAVRERVQTLAAHVTLSPHGAAERPDATLALRIGDAIGQGRRLALGYRAADGAVTERLVEPYGLAGWRGRWYLVAHCCTRSDYRLFRLDRIRSAAVQAATFTRESGFDWAAFVSKQLSHPGATWQIDVEFEATPERVRQLVPAGYGEITASERGARFSYSHPDLGGAARHLIGLNLPFVVRGPPELRAELAGIAGRIRRAIEPPQAGL